MPSLAETQARLSAAILKGDAAAVAPLLVGGRDPRARLVIHQRHYEASLVTALTTKFPATVWLIGDALFTVAARAFVRRHPPAAPCIAEYAEDFPGFIAAWPGADRAPYLGAVASADWLLGQAALAVDLPPLPIQALAGIEAEMLPDLELSLQMGLRYMHADWPVDELVKLHLDGNAPERYVLDPEEVWLEIRGVRGAFSLDRLAEPAYLFRRAVKSGSTIGAAAEAALAADPAFDAGAALGSLFADGLVTSVNLPA
ncbi:MAG: DNA-binding domain-containing protein [Hyphomicrobiales bacterium]|nr:DNA-binding domain-containing protein [Hyphomicrobiales bacterium]